MKQLCCVLLAAVIVVACDSGRSPPASTVSASSDKAAAKGDTIMVDLAKLVDPARMAKVPVVLRVRSLGSGVSDKYAWVQVKVLSVIKNTTRSSFAGEMQIAYYSGQPGVPDGECTVYLEAYSDAADHPWKLLGGSGQQGVSHVTP